MRSWAAEEQGWGSVLVGNQWAIGVAPDSLLPELQQKLGGTIQGEHVMASDGEPARPGRTTATAATDARRPWARARIASGQGRRPAHAPPAVPRPPLGDSLGRSPISGPPAHGQPADPRL